MRVSALVFGFVLGLRRRRRRSKATIPAGSFLGPARARRWHRRSRRPIAHAGTSITAITSVHRRYGDYIGFNCLWSPYVVAVCAAGGADARRLLLRAARLVLGIDKCQPRRCQLAPRHGVAGQHLAHRLDQSVPRRPRTAPACFLATLLRSMLRPAVSAPWIRSLICTSPLAFSSPPWITTHGTRAGRHISAAAQFSRAEIKLGADAGVAQRAHHALIVGDAVAVEHRHHHRARAPACCRSCRDAPAPPAAATRRSRNPSPAPPRRESARPGRHSGRRPRPSRSGRAGRSSSLTAKVSSTS